ncbi:ankyrin repeat domain-containing protein, partial [Endozoicomonas sp.]|uniref:ankyrin repeat domain-containing protein n=1 Tax=Endozoicomonas sp. TaxID=1892382 RepID=UPI00383B9230
DTDSAGKLLDYLIKGCHSDRSKQESEIVSCLLNDRSNLKKLIVQCWKDISITESTIPDKSLNELMGDYFNWVYKTYKADAALSEITEIITTSRVEDLNKKGKYGVTPLMLSLGRKDTTVFRLLMKRGVDCKSITLSMTLVDTTALHQAAKMGADYYVRYLIEIGKVDVNERDASGDTPLHAAKSVSAARILVAARANVNLVNSQGRTPLHLAVNRSNAAVVTLLISNSAVVDQADKRQVTPLILASSIKGYGNIVELLLAAGADVDHEDVGGLTALYVAAVGYHFETAKMLIKAGANLDKANNDGDTPRMRLNHRREWYPEKIKELETLAAKIARTAEGR